MDKTEELLNALLTDAEVDNFIPDSRFEEILLCCIKKENSDKCGNPQSRGELLLQKLAEKLAQSSESTESGQNKMAQLVDNSITEVTESDLAGATNIGNYAFCDCDRLTNIVIPNSVTNIGNRAFYGCSKLTNAIIPDSVTSIGEYSFYGCISQTSVIIPDSVTNIKDHAFEANRSLTSITIPDSVTNIGSSAFQNCGLNTESGTIYTILATTPPTIQSTTFQSAKINKIIVPDGTADTYKAAANWSDFADYIEEATE